MERCKISVVGVMGIAFLGCEWRCRRRRMYCAPRTAFPQDGPPRKSSVTAVPGATA
jgi:hypothetical protein